MIVVKIPMIFITEIIVVNIPINFITEIIVVKIPIIFITEIIVVITRVASCRPLRFPPLPRGGATGHRRAQARCSNVEPTDVRS